MEKGKKGLGIGLTILMVTAVLGSFVPIAFAQPTATSFGVDDAEGYPDTNVLIPVNITNVQNGPVPTIIFNILYNNSVINVTEVQRGTLTSNWGHPNYCNHDWGTSVVIYTSADVYAVQNGSTGSVALLNFSVIGESGATSVMDLSNIQLADLNFQVGTAPANNGSFTVLHDDLTGVWIDDDFNEGTQGWQYDHFDLIQDGIDAATEYMTVFVYNGTYYENLVINKPLKLTGEGRNLTVIDGGGNGDAIHVSGDSVNITGFAIENGGEEGICLVNADYCHIYDNILADNGDVGLFLDQSNNNTVSGVTIHNNTYDGILLEDSHYNDLVGNTVYWNGIGNNGEGILLKHSKYCDITNNTVYENGEDGILLEPSSSNNSITNNTVSGNTDCGILLSTASNFNIISDNEAHNNTYDGILIEDSQNILLLNNSLHNNQEDGICLLSCTDNCVHGNRIEDNNGTGIVLNSSSDNLIYNNYLENTDNAWDNGNNQWNITKTNSTNIIGGQHQGGHYWSDYTGNETGREAIGDTPYSIPGGTNKDYLPLAGKQKAIRDAIRDAIQDKGANWTVGITSVSELSVEEKKMLCGVEIGEIPVDAVALSPTHNVSAGTSFDWRNKDGQNWVTPVENQGSCGSCWIFGATAAFETQINIDASDPTIDFDASEQNVLSCLSGGWGCGGGWPPNALAHIRDLGVPDDACFPYQANDGVPCSSKCADWQDRAWTLEQIGYPAEHTTACYKDLLVNHGPMVVVLEVYDDFYYYTGGVYEHVMSSEGFGGANHCVMLVGYDDNVGPNGCWIIKNSWGSGWGMNGYAYVEYGDLEKYNYAWVVMDTSGPDTQPDTQTLVVLDDTVEDVGWSQSYWDEDGLWDVTESRSNSGTHSWWYGQESTGDYDTGIANSGCLVSEVIDLTGAVDATLNFWTYWETEDTGRDYDKKLVEISTDGGTTWSVLEQLYAGMQGDISVSLEDYVGEGVMIRFCFDTVDELYNDYEGWFVDDVKLEAEVLVATMSDLTITSKYDENVEGGFSVTYTIENIWGCDAGESNTCIYIDGEEVLVDSVPGLSAGAGYTNTVGPFGCPCGTTVNVSVCADCDGAVVETDETNNCMENERECPKPAIEVRKTVRDLKTGEWEDVILANVSDVVRFQIWVHNSGGCCNLTGIVVDDTLPEGLEYAGNASVAPDEVVTNADGTTTLYWGFAGPVEYNHNLSIEFDGRKTRTGKDRNCVNVSGWCNETELHVQVFDEDCALVRAGPDDTGVFRNGKWYVDTNGDQGTDITFNYGTTGDIPVFGDIDKDGRDDMGVFRNGKWYVDTNGDQGTDITFNYGTTGDIPVFGDIDKDGRDDMGVFRNGKWYVDTNGDQGTDITFNYGTTGDIPVFGDIDKDGRDDMGVFRNGKWYVDTNGDQGTDITFNYGTTGDIPVFGDIDKDGRDDMGVFRNGKWYVDTNGDHGTDITFNYGTTGDLPVFGDYTQPGDLTVTEKFETPLANGTFTVTYTVCNIGEEGVGASTTNIYIDNVEVATDPVSALSACVCYTKTVGPFDCPCGTTVSVKVCADDKEIVTESDETNNCWEVYRDCPECPAIAIEVNKAVWNTKTSEWADAILANVSDVVQFRIWLNNSGDYNLTNIVVDDTLPEGLEYAGNASVAPDVIVNNSDGTTTLYWGFAGPVEYNHNLSIEFDGRKTRTGKDRNCVNVSGWCNETELHVQVFDEDCALVRAGPDDTGVFRNGKWYVDTNGDQGTDITFNYGTTGDIPVFGDIDKDGRDDMGVFRNGKWYVDTNGDQGTDITFNYGTTGDIPVFGDIDKDGRDDMGVFRNGKWYVDTNGDHGTDITFNYGTTGDIPVFGDIDKDGRDDMGVFRNGKWYVDTNGDQGTDITFNYGTTGDIPVFGDIDKDGRDDMGVFRNGKWYVDTNGDHGTDITFNYGTTGDLPVFGDYTQPGDLTVTEKFETPLANGTFTVTYTVCNIGEEGVGASTTNIYIDNVEVATDPVSALSACVCYTKTVGPFDCPCGTTVSVKVCADDKEIVTESDETNNCWEVYRDCPECPAIAIEVNKAVWNTKTSEWADAILANVSDVVQFRIWLNNSGDYNLTNIVVDDTLPEGLEYAGNASVAPDVIVNNSDGTTTLYWGFAGPVEYNHNLSIEFDGRKTRTGKDRNCVNVSGWCNETELHVQVFDEDCALVRAGPDDTGVFRNGKWYVDTNGDQGTDITFNYGTTGDIPVFGDIDKDGRDDMGVFRNGKWYVDTNGDQGTDITFNYGTTGDIPVFGDIDKDGRDDMGVFRNGKWYVDTNGDHGTDITFNYGTTGDIPVFGDIDKDGRDDMGVFRNGKWYVDTNGDQGTDITFNYGTTGDIPVFGDIDKDGRDDMGVFRNGKWYVDTNGDHGTDITFNYGTTGDLPVFGDIK